jgi:hypothetical protein
MGRVQASKATLLGCLDIAPHDLRGPPSARRSCRLHRGRRCRCRPRRDRPNSGERRRRLGRDKTSSGRISLTARSGFPSQLGWVPAAFRRPLVAVAPPAICRGRRGGRGPLAMAVPNHVRPRHTQTGRRCALAAMHFLCAWSLRHRNTQFRGKFRCGLRQ